MILPINWNNDVRCKWEDDKQQKVEVDCFMVRRRFNEVTLSTSILSASGRPTKRTLNEFVQ